MRGHDGGMPLVCLSAVSVARAVIPLRVFARRIRRALKRN